MSELALVRQRAIDDDFAEFYAAYPRKVARKAAQQAYRRARKDTDATTILDALGKFKSQTKGSEQRFIPHPASWLNAGRWMDETAPQPAQGSQRWYDSDTGAWVTG